MKEFVGKHVVFIVENNSIPFDKRVWREALAIKKQGANVSIISPKDNNDQKQFEILNGIEIYRFNLGIAESSKFRYIQEYATAFLKTVYYLIKIRKKIDVIHVANPPDIFWPLAIYCKIKKIKFIFDEHDLTPETYLSRYNIDESEGGIFYKILKYFQLLSYKFSDAIISTNESYKQRAIQTYLPAKGKIFVVRNGPDVSYFHLKEPNKSLKKGRQYLFAYIGIMAYQDGVEYIVRAVDYLVKIKKFNNFIVYLIGSGSDIKRLKKMVSDLNLENYIIFTGRIPDEPALEILSTADVCLSPDPYNPLNNFSTMNKVMEYMALGKPIVSFDLVEAKYSAREAALYVKNNDAQAFAEGMYKLATDTKLSKKMGNYGQHRLFNELSWQHQIPRLIEVYKFVIS